MIPNDYCRCTGKNCERRETCERYIAWRDKTGGPFVSVSNMLCRYTGPSDFYIPVKEQS